MSLRLIEIVADILPADFPNALRIDAMARPDGKTEYRILVRASRLSMCICGSYEYGNPI